MEKIAILADSGCQIPVGSRENEGIFIATLTIIMEGKSYLDDIEIHSIYFLLMLKILLKQEMNINLVKKIKRIISY